MKKEENVDSPMSFKKFELSKRNLNQKSKDDSFDEEISHTSMV